MNLRLSAGIDREPWQARLHIPNYRIKDAAKFADISPQTIANWQRLGGSGFLPRKPDRAALSYLQLIELAVVASFRKGGVKLHKIKAAREWLQKQIESEYPFAQHRFKTDGKELLMEYRQIEPNADDGHLVVASNHGQLGWSDILNRLKEFEYDKASKIVSQWHVDGMNSPVVIDPKVSFGAPTVRGIPTWAVRDRWKAGSDLKEIADDYELSRSNVIAALRFEEVSWERQAA